MVKPTAHPTVRDSLLLLGYKPVQQDTVHNMKLNQARDKMTQSRDGKHEMSEAAAGDMQHSFHKQKVLSEIMEIA